MDQVALPPAVSANIRRPYIPSSIDHLSIHLLATKNLRLFSISLTAGGVGLLLRASFSWEAFSLLGSGAIVLGVMVYVVCKVALPYFLSRSAEKHLISGSGLQMVASRFMWAGILDVGSDLGLVVAGVALTLPWVGIPLAFGALAAGFSLGYVMSASRIQLLAKRPFRFRLVILKAQSLSDSATFTAKEQEKVGRVCRVVLRDYFSLYSRRIEKSFSRHISEEFSEQELAVHVEGFWDLFRKNSYRQALLERYQNPLLFSGQPLNSKVASVLSAHFLRLLEKKQRDVYSGLFHVNKIEDFLVIQKELSGLKEMEKELPVIEGMILQSGAQNRSSLFDWMTQLADFISMRLSVLKEFDRSHDFSALEERLQWQRESVQQIGLRAILIEASPVRISEGDFLTFPGKAYREWLDGQDHRVLKEPSRKDSKLLIFSL